MDDASWDLIQRSLVPLATGIVRGTIPLTALSFVIGLVLALVVALMRLSGVAPLVWVARAFVSVVRGTPLLVQLFLIYYGLPEMGVPLDPFPSAVIAFSVNVGGYASEIIRSAILAVPTGQTEAALTIGMGRVATLRRIILPQASRVAVPPLSNTLIALVKDTSLASAVQVNEVLRRASEIAGPTYEFFLLYGLAAIYYWIVCLVLSFVQGRVETRLDRFVTK